MHLNTLIVFFSVMVIPGKALSDLRIVEISPSSSPEWIELKNTSDESIELPQYFLCDMEDGDTILLPERELGPYGIIAVSSDSAALRPGNPIGGIGASPHWSTLLNSGAGLVLFSMEGPVDTAVYPSGLDNGSSYVRVYPDRSGKEASSWIECTDPTPGSGDTRLEWRTVSAPRLILDKQVFSPDGDGTDDRFPIKLSLPPGYSAELLIYSLDGSQVWSFGEVNQELLWWNGTDNAGRPAPRGPFVVVLRILQGDSRTLLRGSGVLWR